MDQITYIKKKITITFNQCNHNKKLSLLSKLFFITNKLDR